MPVSVSAGLALDVAATALLLPDISVTYAALLYACIGKGLETLSNDLEISLGEAESWIAAFSAAFPALGRKLSALRRRGDGRASGRASGTDARTASATDARTDARTLAGRLLVDSRYSLCASPLLASSDSEDE